MPNDDHQQRLIEELSSTLDRAIQLLNEIKGYSSPNHKWVKKQDDDFRGYVHVWWHCEKCSATPTKVKPHLANEDRPLESPCPGPVLYADNPGSRNEIHPS